MARFDIVTVLAHVVLVTTLATMVYSVLVYVVSRRRSRKPSARKPLPPMSDTQTAPVVKIYPLP